MSQPDKRTPVEAIRQAARLAVEATSLRSVARAVGMSPMGLKHFLEGRRPYSATLRKLNVWYVAHALEQQGFSEDAARAALALLLDGIPETGRDAAAAAVLDDLLRTHRHFGSRPPAWLVALHSAAAEPD
jgi:AcrR family transcriptional regulator